MSTKTGFSKRDKTVISTKPGGPETVNDTGEECCLIMPGEKDEGVEKG